MPRALYQLSRPLTTFRQQFSLHPPARYIHKMAMSTSMLPKVILNDNETRLARLLVECADWIDQHPEQVDQLRLRDEQGQWIGKLRTDEKVELRIAGGWVRDKLLGRESDDIDVSTSPDPITGLKFATLFERYLEQLGQRHLMGRLTKIEAKPEQSKHLETATAMVCNLSVDWVQQRGQESYTSGSRIPTVVFGTPLEDAERRDLTINALFYNLRTREIEDQTGKGLADLGFVPGQPKRIRTPLEPFRTFHDDPLRVIRAVRFAARFGREYELNEDLVAAIGRDEIRAALRDPKKISRERVGVELEKMLLGKDPFYAMELIDRLGLHDLIFLYEPTEVSSFSSNDHEPVAPARHQTLIAARILTQLLRPGEEGQELLHPLLQLHVEPMPVLAAQQPVSPFPSTTDVQRVYPVTIKRLYLACSLLPLQDLAAPDKKKVVWVGEKVVRDGIKWPSADVVWARKARDASLLLRQGVEVFGQEGRTQSPRDRVELGLLLRNVAVHDMLHTRWNVSIFWSLVAELMEVQGDPHRELATIAKYNRFVDQIVALDLATHAFDPPLLDGKQVNELVPSTRKSAAMTNILARVVEWQLAHPHATIEECRAWLLSHETLAEIESLIKDAQVQAAGPSKGSQKHKKVKQG